MTDNMNNNGLGGGSSDLGGGSFGGPGVGGTTGGLGGGTGMGGASSYGTPATGGFGGDTADTLGGLGSHQAAGIKEQAQQKVQEVRGEAMKLKDQALDQARSAAEDGKAKAADTIDGVAQAARDAASQLGQNPTIAPVARYGTQAAEALERFASTLRNKEVDQLVGEVAGMVRRNPAIAVGVAVAAGFAISRLLRGGGTNTHSVGGFTANDDYVA